MLGYDCDYVPGWDCHGLPIEWKIEEEYRAKGKHKDDVPIAEFRKECRELRRALDRRAARASSSASACMGDWDDPYTTMAFAPRRTIGDEMHEIRR